MNMFCFFSLSELLLLAMTFSLIILLSLNSKGVYTLSSTLEAIKVKYELCEAGESLRELKAF